MYCQGLMTEAEQAADRYILYEVKAHASAKSRSQALPLFLRKMEGVWSPEVADLLRDGTDTFRRSVRDRILSTGARDQVLNLCPRCGAMTRTPRAKQCPACFHDWHDEETKK